MTMPQGPQGHPGQQPPSGPNPNNPTEAFASPGRVPQGPPVQGPPAQNQPPGSMSQGMPAQGQPRSGPPDGRFPGPPQQGQHLGGPPPQRGPSGGPGQWTPAPPSQGQFGAPNHVGAPRPQSANAIWSLGLVSLIAVVAGLSISEDGANAWETVHAWGGLAILGSLLTLATVAAGGNLTAARAWQVAACGAGALVLFWVLFVLPGVGSNTSLVTTIGVAAGVVAVWIAPGRESTTNGADDAGHRW